MRRRGIIALGVLGLAAGLASGCATFRRQKRDEAVVTARQLSLRGVDAMEHGRMAEAESLFRRALDICPTDERIQRNYAETLWRSGRRRQAIAHMEEAVRLSGGNAELLVRLGDMYLAQNDLVRAAEQAERAVRADPRLASAWALRGDVLNRAGRLAEALASYHRALSYQSHYPRVQLAVAEAYQQQGRYTRALATLRALADGYPAGEVPQEVLVRQGIVLKQLGRYDAAVEALTEAAGKGEPSADLLFQLAEAQLQAGDPVNARLTARSALAKAPDHLPSRQLYQRLESIERRTATRPQRQTAATQ